MSVTIPPPRTPSREDELELLIREARARQRKRRLGAAVAVMLLAGSALGLNSVLRGSRPSAVSSGGPTAAVRTGRACGVRGLGIRILGQDGRTLYREPGRWAHPNRGYHPTIRCSGASIWAVFYNGGARPQEEGPFAIHSGDAGRTWEPVFSGSFPRAPRHFDPYLGAWTLRGKSAYFVGWYLAVANRTLEPSSTLWVTRDGGRTFRRYKGPALLGYEPIGLRVSGRGVTVFARRLVHRTWQRKAVSIHIA